MDDGFAPKRSKYLDIKNKKLNGNTIYNNEVKNDFFY